MTITRRKKKRKMAAMVMSKIVRGEGGFEEWEMRCILILSI